MDSHNTTKGGGSRKEKAPSPATSGQGDRAKGEGKKEQTTKEEKTVVEVESGGEKSSKKKGKKKQHEEETKKQDPVPATNQTVFASQVNPVSFTTTPPLG